MLRKDSTNTLRRFLSTRLTAVLAMACLCGFSSLARADLLLEVDLTTTDQVTITATSGLSSGTVSGADVFGVYFEDFYSGPGASLIITTGVGNLTNAANPSDGSPGIYRDTNDPGFVLWSFSSDIIVDFTAGQLAFIGDATWNLTSSAYGDAIADGNRTGNLYFAADQITDFPGPTLIGTYNVVVTPDSSGTLVPEPASIALWALLGLGLFAFRRFRRRR